MTTNKDQFYTKLYAIQPFKETESPASSASKSQAPPQMPSDPLVPTVLNFPQPESFLNSTSSLKKVCSEHPPPPQLHLGQSNRKTMTSISSTIDILFSKIEKIKQEFSFALDKPHSGAQEVSEWSFKLPHSHSQGDPNHIIDKENQVHCDEKLTKIESKISAVMEKLNKSRPLEPKASNRHQGNNLEQWNQKKNKEYRDIFRPWGEQQKVRGLTISDFSLGRCIGSGKFGDVYMSQHKPTGFICAIKKILKSTILQYNMIQQFTKELRIHYSLDHPNIVKLYSHFQDEYHIFLLMELSPHGSLIQKLHMPQAETSKIVDQITEALIYTHRKKIIHRDIKPENIVVTMGVPKLCDFGWATINQSRMHQTFCGTLDYVSPEMKDQGEYNESIDLWSVGVLTFQLLAGFPPFKQEISNWKMKGSKRKVKWSWEVLYPPEIQNQSKDFIQSLLQVNPNLRSSLNECKRHSFLRKYRDGGTQTFQYMYLFQ